MFEVGELASDELVAIAQAGDEGPMFRHFSASDKVTQAVDVGRPVTRSGQTFGDFTDTITFEITGAPGDKFSIATMLICTNDGFLGLDAVKLPMQGAQDFFLAGYDAGREENTERSEDLVDPCSALGPMRGAVSISLASDKETLMQPHVREDAAQAVKELRLVVSLYGDVQVPPGSRQARKLEAARRAIAAYEEAERWERERRSA